MANICDYVDWQNVAHLTTNDNILVTQFREPSQLRGLYEFSRLNEPSIKMVLFYDKNLPPNIIQKLLRYKNVITCAYSKPSNFYKYIPIIESPLKYNLAYICDISMSRFYLRLFLSSFKKIIAENSQHNTYLLSLGAELAQENLDLESQFNLCSWHRLSPDDIVMKKYNEFPSEMLNDCFDSDDVNYLMLKMMQYIQDNSISFDYKISSFGNKIPFYYWLERTDVTEEKRVEFLNKMGSTDSTVEDYLKTFTQHTRRELYSKIQYKFGDLSFFEDPRLIACIKRIITYFRYDDSIIYCKKW